ncbi:hypothetical protein GBA63_20805 [Rubrobacter tropicus]|uniref:Uncharacterized protein n=1 Tax=Rubrobacter tropicus TaxID=2653851 RepID=A0A6G8QED7_9ACTN|nr:hypothetical protein [Rubrobacter tropicus]QIN84813.1 hypothetical protein GBA63_20805 [Rubrobacter tropicus]
MSNAWGSGSGRFTVVAIAVALLFCHGAFGYAHQSPPADAHGAHVAHAPGGHDSVPDRGVDGMHQGGAYFATLLALFFVTLLLFGGRALALGRLPAPNAGERARRTEVSFRPRGPTLTSLQVFRL